MSKLMKAGPVIIDGLEERGLRRDADIVVAAMIESFAPADAEVCRRGGNRRLGGWYGLGFAMFSRRFARGLRQAFALLDVEDGKAFEERNA